MAHVEETAAGFANDSECLDEQIVESSALGEPLFEVDGFCLQVDIGELLRLRLELIDGRDHRQQGFDFALVLGPENFGQNGVNHEVISRGRNSTFILAQGVGGRTA